MREENDVAKRLVAKIEIVNCEDLQPGDLFTTATQAYWDATNERGSIGEKVYVRTNEPCPKNEVGESISRVVITVEDT